MIYQLHAQGDRPLSHRSSQRAEALRQLRELWFSDEAEQPGTPDLPRGTELPSPLHAAARICHGHADASSAPQRPNSAESPAPEHAAAAEGSACNDSDNMSPHQQPRQVSGSASGLHAAACEEHRSASTLASGDERRANRKLDLSSGVDVSDTRKDESNTQHDAESNGNRQDTERPGHERYESPSSSPGAQDSHPGDLPRDDRPQPQQESRDVSTQRADCELQGSTEESLPVSVGAARVSSDAVAQANAVCLARSLEGTTQLPRHVESSASDSSEVPTKAVGRRGEPAWVTGFRSDMGRALETPFLHPGPQPSRSAQSTPGVSPAAAAAGAARHKLSWQNGWAETDGKVPSGPSSPWKTPLKASGV